MDLFGDTAAILYSIVPNRIQNGCHIAEKVHSIAINFERL